MLWMLKLKSSTRFYSASFFWIWYAGLVLLGPITALIAGAGSAYAATRKDKAGDAFRSVGSVATGAYDATVNFNK